MIDLNLLRENPEAIEAYQRARGRDEALVNQAVEADAKRRLELNKTLTPNLFQLHLRKNRQHWLQQPSSWPARSGQQTKQPTL